MKNTRVQFAPEEHQLVKQAAKKQLISFNKFVSGLAVAVAKRVLEAPADNVTEQLAAQIWPGVGASLTSASSRTQADV